MSKETFYFTHDYNTRTDEKIKNLIRIYVMRGYGIFWAIIEDLYNNANAMRLDYECIAYELREDKEIINHIINDFDLFSFEDGYFGSTSVERRLDERNKKSESARQSAFTRWNKKQSNANAMRTHKERNAIKEIKEIKEKKRNIFIPPNLNEIEGYFIENGYRKEIALKAFNYYSCADWHDSKGNKIRNWKQKMQAVWFKPENRITPDLDEEENKKRKLLLYGKSI